MLCRPQSARGVLVTRQLASWEGDTQQNSNLLGTRFPSLLPPVWAGREYVVSQSGRGGVEITNPRPISLRENCFQNVTNVELLLPLENCIWKSGADNLLLAPPTTLTLPSLQHGAWPRGACEA